MLLDGPNVESEETLVKVLVVDDDPSVRSLLENQIGLCGFEVTAFPDAETAWEACQHEQFLLNVVDWQLPGMDGLEFCRKLRTLPGGEYCVILIVTGRKMADDLRKTLEAGADDYLAKPVSLELMKVRMQVAEKLLCDNLARKEADEALRIAHRELHQALKERSKELACLYGISRLVEMPDMSLDKLLGETVELLPPSWQHAEITCARISVGGKEYKTARFQHSAWMQTAQASVDEGRALIVEVGYLEARPSSAEGPFLAEERHLIDAVAERLARIIERTEAKHEAESARKQLNLADRMASLGILVAGVAHEVNNPNHLIMANAQQVSKAWVGALPILDEFYEENGDFILGGLKYSEMRARIGLLCSGILEGSQNIKAIVEELRDYARQDPADVSESVNLNRVAEMARRLLRNQVAKSTEQFQMLFDEEIPAVGGNTQRLTQVVVNLIQNACQALTDKGKGILLRTGYDAVAREVYLVVEDEGIGIIEDDMNHLTDPFFTTKRDSGGTGLGLSISSTIVQEHGGRLEFSSTPGEGATVTMRLPVVVK